MNTGEGDSDRAVSNEVPKEPKYARAAMVLRGAIYAFLTAAVACQVGNRSETTSSKGATTSDPDVAGSALLPPPISAATPAPTSTYHPLYATWLMVWVDHNQPWWSVAGVPTIDYNGTLLPQDYADAAVLSGTLDAVKNAGISAVILDLTNGWGWLNDRTQQMQQLATARNMQVVIADAPNDPNNFEQHASDIWGLFAGPSAPYKDSYLNVDGKPIIVLYVVRQTFEAFATQTSPYASKFSLVWASGEDSNADKWGWQLVSSVGGVPSANTMYVTSSVKTSDTQWRKSLAFFDYNFSLVRQNHPRIVVVGSFDDYNERNFWAVSDTFNSEKHSGSGQQMFDWTGATSATAFYERTSLWMAGKADAVAGGPVPDGDYRLVNMQTSQTLNDGNNTSQVGTPVVMQTKGTANSDHYWLHHLGHSTYRITQLRTGLSMAANSAATPGDDATVVQALDSTDANQRWRIAEPTQGTYTLQNIASNMLLKATEANAIVQDATAGDASQKWQLQVIMPFTPQ